MEKPIRKFDNIKVPKQKFHQDERPISIKNMDINKIVVSNKNILKKEFVSEPVYNEKYLKTKVKSYNENTNTNFHDNKIPKEGSEFICLSVILIDSVFKTGKNYYAQVFLEEYKRVVKKRFLSTLLMIWEFLLIPIKKTLINTILMKKIPKRKFLKKFR